MRMLIGNSLGGCLQSLMRGEVSEDEVLLLITRTASISHEGLMSIVEQYHSNGNFGASHPDQYKLSEFPLDAVKALASRLYRQGKIHQPRNFGVYSGFIHSGLAQGHSCWVEVNPLGLNTNPVVVEAYEKYRVLDALTK